jgi:hypothetical protein
MIHQLLIHMNKSIKISPDISQEELKPVPRIKSGMLRCYVTLRATPTQFWQDSSHPISQWVLLDFEPTSSWYDRILAIDVLMLSTKDGFQFRIVEGVTTFATLAS